MDIKDLEGKIVLINFWATWCGPCLRELPELNKFVTTLDSQDFVVLAIARDQDTGTIKEHIVDKDYKFAFVPDEGKSIYLNFADKGIPRNVLLNAEGKILFQTLGYNLDEFQEMENMIKEELSKLSN
jgi:thiol-disulfide isomerase/thioredoxin